MQLIVKKIAAISAITLSSVVSAGTMGEAQSVNFSGLYAGLGTGWMSLLSNPTASYPSFSGNPLNSDQFRTTNTSILFDGHVGYGRVLPSQYYLGVKGSVYYPLLQNRQSVPYFHSAGPIEISGAYTNAIDFKPLYNIDAVLGHLVSTNYLAFIEAGVSFANIANRDTQVTRVTNLATSSSVTSDSLITLNEYKTGYNIGIGMSHLMTSNLAVSAELVYHYLGKYDSTHVLPRGQTTINQQYQSVSGLFSLSYLVPNL